MMESNVRYEDLLSGDYLYVDGIGHVKSPKLKEMSPSTGIGWDRYNYYITLMRLSDEQLSSMKIEKDENDTIFDCLTKNEPLRKLYLEAFSFFMLERVVYEEKTGRFLCATMKDEKVVLSGEVTKENFDTLRGIILTVNYISLADTDIKTKHSSDAAKERWESIQKHLAAQQAAVPKDDKLTIGNMLSKVCAIHPSINYSNVFDLTVFQFYDSFFQCCYMRQTEFSEAIVSNHGSKDFKYENWLNPVKNY